MKPDLVVIHKLHPIPEVDAFNTLGPPRAFGLKIGQKIRMTPVSTFGLGFQLLVIGVKLVTGDKEYVIPFFLGHSLLIPIFISVRKVV